ncbi:MAG: hypothetical protein AAF889_05820 [Cyanobacteria bacterium P01_D01_bin.73]
MQSPLGNTHPFPINSIVCHADYPDSTFRVIGHLGPDLCKLTCVNTPGRFAQMANIRQLSLLKVIPPSHPETRAVYTPRILIRNV